LIQPHLRIGRKCLGYGVASAIAKDWKSTHIKDYVSIDKEECRSLEGSLVTTKDVYFSIDLLKVSQERSKTSL